MPTPPTVSVIIPCCNLGQYLDEAVASVLAQTYQDFEIVIVDDGSTDPATQALLADYQRPRTHVIRAPHEGLAAARNLAIASTSGAYLCALDADDYLDPSFLEKMVPILEADPSLTFVSCWLRTFGEEEWEWKPERCDLPTLLWENTILTAALVRREAVVAVGGFNQTMPAQGDEDWDLWLTLVERGYRGMILREVLFNYRRRAGSMSTDSWYGPSHVPLANYRVPRHQAIYRAHLVDVLLHQDGEIGELLRRNDELERDMATRLEPAVALRRDELNTLQSRLALAVSKTEADTSLPVMTEHIGNLEVALEAASREVTALRTSKSWRMTTPLRKACDLWLRWRGSV
jgi:glycosyltransferase involved in cell wall biosynthesis